jgi:HD-like signal output (HDOD) protein
LARQAITGGGQSLLRFWEVSSMRAHALVFLTRKLRVCPPDIAHTFGLFCDIGVPLLMDRFPDYLDTFAAASIEPERSFTQVEDARHMTNHAAIGCLLARNWGLSENVSAAILLHHSYAVLDDKVTEPAVRSLVAISLLAEKAIQKHQGNVDSVEWRKGGALACQHLGLPEQDVDDLLEELQAMFSGKD